MAGLAMLYSARDVRGSAQASVRKECQTCLAAGRRSVVDKAYHTLEGKEMRSVDRARHTRVIQLAWYDLCTRHALQGQ